MPAGISVAFDPLNTPADVLKTGFDDLILNTFRSGTRQIRAQNGTRDEIRGTGQKWSPLPDFYRKWGQYVVFGCIESKLEVSEEILGSVHSFLHIVHVQAKVLESHVDAFVPKDLGYGLYLNTGMEHLTSECSSQSVV